MKIAFLLIIFNNMIQFPIVFYFTKLPLKCQIKIFLLIIEISNFHMDIFNPAFLKGFISNYNSITSIIKIKIVNIGVKTNLLKNKRKINFYLTFIGDLVKYLIRYSF